MARETALREGDICELTVTSLSHDGRAVGRVGRLPVVGLIDKPARQFVLFVQDALPGQTVRACVTAVKKSFAEAQCIEIIRDFPKALAPACPHAQFCGGCTLQSMPYDMQLHWKKHILYDALQHIGHISHVTQHDVCPSPTIWGYRNKMTFAFGEGEDGKLILGLRKKGTHTVLDVGQCKLMPPECMDVLKVVSDLCAELRFPVWTEEHGGVWRFVTIRRPKACNAQGEQQCLVHVITGETNKTQREAIEAVGERLLGLTIKKPNTGAEKRVPCMVTGFVHDERLSATAIAQGEQEITRRGQDELWEELAGVRYACPHDSFFQVNTEAAEKLCAHLTALPVWGNEAVHCLWDVYCGVGAPGLNLLHGRGARQGFCLYGVELQKRSVHAAHMNAARHMRPPDAFQQGTVPDVFRYNYQTGLAHECVKKWPQAHTILVDPPRAGLHKALLQTLIKSRAQHIIYISCNPATLARDVALLQSHYTIDSIQGFDFFPHTTHVESCTHLVRKNT